MSLHEIKELKVGRLIGDGECGRVYAARTRDGEDVALKVFHGMAISRRALQASVERLAAGGWPDGVMRVLESDYHHRPAYQLTPMAGEIPEGGGDVAPRSLQHQIDAHPGADTWAVVRGIAEALAAMHHKRVAHANLKPGNVFFNESGDVLLADWALGNMPGVGRLRFTDALLYQSPAQLRSPDGYLHDDGYRWDVYAFGTLAYRLLTGRFPRCHEIFASVAPPQGVTRRDDVDADMLKVARNLEKQPTVTWPDEPVDDLEAGMCEWILRCLELDAHQRPASMIDVVAGFARVEKDVATRDAHAELLDQRRRAGRRAMHAYFAFGIATAAAVAMAAMWWMEADRLGEAQAANAEMTTAVEAANAAVESANAATAAADAAVESANAATAAADAALLESEAEAQDAIETSERELEAAMARLRASRDVGDRLFAWTIEQDHRQLPPLDGRDARLEFLEAYYDGFLDDVAGIDGLEVERARARLQLAEVSLVIGDPVRAHARLAELLAASDDLADDPTFAIRMARNMVLLGILQQNQGQNTSIATFRQAREMLDALPPADATIDGDRIRHFSAVVDIHLATHLAMDGADDAALESLVEATATLNELADARPESMILRAKLAEAYNTSASILDRMGRPGEARETRELAISGLRTLLEETPDDPALMLELAGALGTMAEAAVRTGNIDEASEKSGEATALLDRVIASQPENTTATSRKAAQLGLQAGILRDEGRADEAVGKYSEGILLLEAVRKNDPDDPVATYRLALLTWQMARMLGIEGERDEEIAMLRMAADLMEHADSTASHGGPRKEQTDLSSAYLFGDLGHALELAEDQAGAVAAFARACEFWRALVAADPDREEFADGLAWCERRLAELKE